MEIVDELKTPGCPQCAIKHLSAALSYEADDAGRLITFNSTPYEELVARAYINLGEVLIGYRSHLWFAVGLLQRAEESELRIGGRGLVARSVRLLLESRGESAVREAMADLYTGVAISDLAFVRAHVDEARRELPGLTFPDGSLAKAIELVRQEYFPDVAEGTVPEAHIEEGEMNMATAKKSAPAAKKTAPAVKKPAPAVKKAAPVAKKPVAKKTAPAAKKSAGKTCKGGSCSEK